MKIIFLILITFSFSLAGELKNKAENQIKSLFDGTVSLEFTKLEIDPEFKSGIEKRVKQRFFKNFVYVWKIMLRDSLTGLAVLDNVYGKTMPITFMVIFEPDGKIKQTMIIKYREDYGGAVSNVRWLDQFNNKDRHSGFSVGEDIDTISGATISVNSVSKGIQKIAALFPYIIEKLSFK